MLVPLTIGKLIDFFSTDQVGLALLDETVYSRADGTLGTVFPRRGWTARGDVRRGCSLQCG